MEIFDSNWIKKLSSLPVGLVLAYGFGFLFPESQLAIITSGMYMVFYSREAREKIKIYHTAVWFVAAILVGQDLRVLMSNGLNIPLILLSDALSLLVFGTFVSFLHPKNTQIVDAPKPVVETVSLTPWKSKKTRVESNPAITLRILTRVAEFLTNSRFQILKMAETSEDLLDHVEKMGELTEAIQKISTQAKILSLNATIEASRMREQYGNLPGILQELESSAAEWGNLTEVIGNQLEEFTQRMRQSHKLCSDSNSLFLTLDQEVEQFQHMVTHMEDLAVVEYESSNGFKHQFIEGNFKGNV
jgi:hypothetical protein